MWKGTSEIGSRKKWEENLEVTEVILRKQLGKDARGDCEAKGEKLYCSDTKQMQWESIIAKKGQARSPLYSKAENNHQPSPLGDGKPRQLQKRSWFARDKSQTLCKVSTKSRPLSQGGHYIFNPPPPPEKFGSEHLHTIPPINRNCTPNISGVQYGHPDINKTQLNFIT